jgi:ABC-type multidrug transport system permease subunit
MQGGKIKMIKEQTKEQNTEAIFLQHSASKPWSGMLPWRRWMILLSILLTSTGVMVLLKSQPLTSQNLVSIIDTVFSAASVISTIVQTLFTIWPNSKSSSTSSQPASRRR